MAQSIAGGLQSRIPATILAALSRMTMYSLDFSMLHVSNSLVTISDILMAVWDPGNGHLEDMFFSTKILWVNIMGCPTNKRITTCFTWSDISCKAYWKFAIIKMNILQQPCFTCWIHVWYYLFSKIFLDGMVYFGQTLAIRQRKPMSSMIENSCELTAIISAIQQVTFLYSGLSYFQGSFCSFTSFNVSWHVSESFLHLITCSSFSLASSCCFT